jgi:hypothetical protein
MFGVFFLMPRGWRAAVHELSLSLRGMAVIFDVI